MTQPGDLPLSQGTKLTRPWRDWLPWVLVTLLALWVRTAFPIWARADGTFDDMLFIRDAHYLGIGAWLGPYDKLTLAKGMFYPLFIVGAFVLAVPLYLAEQLVYLAVCALTARFVWRISGNWWLTLVLYGVLALNPTLWHWEVTRVIREGLYVSLSLGVVLMALQTAFPASSVASRWAGRRLLSGLCLGACLGAFWLTREEGLWIVPVLITVLLISLGAALRRHGVRKAARLTRWSRAVGLPVLLAAVTFGLCVGGVAAVNLVHYGVFITNEFKSTPFLRAYGALARIKQDHWQRYVVISADARQRAYAVSAAARELEPFLDGPGGDDWRRVGCQQTKTSDCTEVLSGWFMWALRDAVAQAGHYKSAPETMRFYNQLADQIDAACQDGRIPCGPPRATMLPVFRWQYLGDTVRDAVAVAGLLMRMGNQEIGRSFSIGPQWSLDVIADLVGSIDPPYPEELIVRGWAGSPLGKPDVSLRAQTGAPVDSAIRETPGTDVVAIHPGWSAVRFQLSTGCPLTDCAVAFGISGQPEQLLPLAKFQPGPVIQGDGLTVWVDDTGLRDPWMAHTRRGAIQIAIARAIGWAYATAFPVLSVVAIAGFVLALVRRRTRPLPAPLLALALACAAAIVVRVTLLAYLDVTSIPSLNILYLSPASPFALVWSVLGCWLLLGAIKLPSGRGSAATQR